MTPTDQTQRERLARIEAPEPDWEQYMGVEWHESETVEPREIRISIRDVVATIGIFSMLAIAAVGFMAVGG